MNSRPITAISLPQFAGIHRGASVPKELTTVRAPGVVAAVAAVQHQLEARHRGAKGAAWEATDTRVLIASSRSRQSWFGEAYGTWTMRGSSWKVIGGETRGAQARIVGLCCAASPPLTRLEGAVPRLARILTHR